jgi:hypothetical protein
MKCKRPLEVAIALNLRDAQVTELYKEYWNLKNLHDLNQVYEEIKEDMRYFLDLYRLSKTAGMNTQHIVNVLAIANNYLPSVERRYEKLKREEAFLQAGNHNSARTFQDLSDHISATRNTLEQYEISCKERRLEINKLNKEYATLEQLVNDFQDNNEEYMKITKTVEEKVVSVVSDVKVLLRCALSSVTESARNDPERYRLIFYNMSGSITDYYSSSCQDYAASYMSGGQIQQQQQHSSPDYNTEAAIAVIVEEAEKLFNKLIKDCINKTITDHTSNKSSLPSLPLLSASEEEQ